MKALRNRAAALLLALILCFPAIGVQADSADTANAIVDGGVFHSIALASNGTVYVWGSNAQMQLGAADPSLEQKTPTEVPGISRVSSVAAGHDYSVALKSDGSVYTWGGGKQSSPTKVDRLNDAVAIAAGQAAILALDRNGRVWQWSLGGAPILVAGLSDIVAIDAGGSHYLALSVSGDVYAWGDNWSGQLGTGNTANSTAPQKLKLNNIIDIAAGQTHSLAVAYDGAVYAWGSNTYGQLGDGTTTNSIVPVRVKSIGNAVQVSAGNEMSMARTKDGGIFTWGSGEYGQLGDSRATSSRNSPQAITELPEPPAFISCGVYHNLYVSQSGNLYTWGRNQDNQLGVQQSGDAATPQLVKNIQAAAGLSYSTANAMNTASSWAQAELQTLYGRKVISPIMWQNFQGNITRAEFAHILITVYEKARRTVVPSKTTNFEDIKGHYFETDIIKAGNLGITSGTSATTFSPENFLTRQEAAKMLCVLLSKILDTGIPRNAPNVYSYYTDAYTIAEWALPYVAYASNLNIMQGTGTRFNPNDYLTREQSLLIVGRMIEQYQWY